MLTRRHIRVKVLQTLYARHQSEDQDQVGQEKFLTQSLEKIQELQALLLMLIVAVRGQAEKFTQRVQQKYFASDNERNPSVNFTNNKLVDLIENHETLGQFAKNKKLKNWEQDDEYGKGGIYNFVTKRGACRGKNSKISWTQVETGSSITWKYPSCLLVGDNAQGEFYSVALTNNYQQADTGTKMIHIGKNTRSRIVSKGISAGNSKNTYRGFVSVNKKAIGARNYSQCDSLLIGNLSNANTFPFISVQNCTTKIEHEASTSKIGEEQIFYFLQRGISIEKGVELMISGFCREVFTELPLEFASEADRLLSLKLEGSVG